VIRFAALRNGKARRWVKGREGLMKKIAEEVSGVDHLVWVHCASLGEFEQGRPLIEEIKLKYPEKKIVLTFYSPSGYDVQKNYKKADFVYYLPLDTRRNAKRFVEYVNPELVFFIKYEYWFNFLSALKKKNISVYFVSTIFRKNQLFFKWYGAWYREMLNLITHLFLQNEESALLLDSINIKNYTVTGDTRFDRVAHVVENVKTLAVVDAFVGDEKIIVAGSTWKAEEAMLLQYVRTHRDVKVILAPHEIEADRIERILELFGSVAIRYSEANLSNVIDKQVLVVDCYGVLTSLYHYGTIAIIGGGFGVGIHNVLEAATFGMPIVFGPNYERFKEAVDLVAQFSAFSVENIEDFNTILNHLLKDEKVTRNISEMSASYVQRNVGATQRIIKTVF
jgi:3-deoxy-D-manno-octulosonic-acid transferase